VTLSELLSDPPLIAILRGVTPAEAPEVGTALVEAGIRSLEVPLNSPSPLESISALRSRLDGKAKIGAGTVLTGYEANSAARAGAEFIVSPVADPAVIASARAAGLVSIPGVFTPAEAFAALAAHADALKLFPAEAASPRMLKSMLAVLPPGTAVVPTGGIEPDSLADWRAAGAAGFGIGGAIYQPGATPDVVRDRAATFVKAWREIA
jgi:2-dehydro-3-deoxyphosphogalactonate aldolase